MGTVPVCEKIAGGWASPSLFIAATISSLVFTDMNRPAMIKKCLHSYFEKDESRGADNTPIDNLVSIRLPLILIFVFI